MQGRRTRAMRTLAKTSAGLSGEPRRRSANHRLNVAYAVVGAFFLPITFLTAGLTSVPVLGAAFVILGAPVWVSSTRKYLGATPVVTGLAIAVASGFVLLYLGSGVYDFDHQRATSLSILVATGFLALPFLLWARTVLGISSLAVILGLGSLLNALVTVDLSSPAWWKSDVSWAFGMILLGFAAKRSSKVPSLLALMVIALISAAAGYRSLAGICIVAACLFLYINKRAASSRWTAILKTAALGIVGPFVAIQVFTWLLLDGALGLAAQQRTYSQIETSGSLIAGGRQEWAASLLLFLNRPMGFGPGVVPHAEDASLGKSGLVSLGANQNSQYINQYMFGGHLKLHSLAADFWANFGLAGLLVICLVGFFLIQALIRAISVGSILALQSLYFLWTLWDLLFSPIDSNYMLMIFSLPILLAERSPSGAQRHGLRDSRDVPQSNGRRF